MTFLVDASPPPPLPPPPPPPLFPSPPPPPPPPPPSLSSPVECTADFPSDSPPNGDAARSSCLPVSGIGQSIVLACSVDTRFDVFLLNVQGSQRNFENFDALLQGMGSPTFVAVTETWLDRTIEAMHLTGYHLVSRLDRRKGLRLDRGGIALYARDGFELSIVHVGDSSVDERSWHIVHADCGPILLGLWYRRPDYAEVASIRRFDDEIQRFSGVCIASIVIGDMNVHNPEWLRWSNRSTPEGTELEAVCCVHGLTQHVHGPTRGNYLLDLVLSTFESGITCAVTPGINDEDHDGVLNQVKLRVPATEPVKRRVYKFRKANWQQLSRRLADTDWRIFFQDLTADEAAQGFSAEVIAALESFVPSKWITDKAFAHPWLNDDCREALQAKHVANGTPDFIQKRDACTAVFRDAQKAYVSKVRTDLKELFPSLRGWLKLSGSLLTKATGRENIPPLKRSDDEWAKTAREKATELAGVVRRKSKLPQRELNEYTSLGAPCDEQMHSFLRLRVRTVKTIMKALDETSGTGPGLLLARLLKMCADPLALPITLLARKLLRKRRWPECWRSHWVHSIFKKGSKAEATNYRGVHLTPQLSKVVERAVGTLLLPWLEAHGAYGPHQYAYGKGKGYKDVLAINVCSWLLALERGEVVGLYCADVSGAFDRVSHERLGDKLQLLGLHPDLLKFVQSWLEDRTSEVVVGGQSSGREVLCDSVFQGTVLGPPLRNTYCADSREATRRLDFTETVFADDYNCFKGFAKGKLPQGLRAEIELKGAQKELHLWGRANRVKFDPSKESFHLLHKRFCSDSKFKILGVLFDSRLLMHSAARQVATEAGWRLQQLLKARRYLSTLELVHLYKAQVLSYMESSTPGIYHAAPTVLDSVDRVQRRLLRQIGASEVDGLFRYRLAPLPSRRDMAMLGVLHKVVLGIAPPQLAVFFPCLEEVHEPLIQQRMRGWRSRHSRQLYTPCTDYSTDVLARSLFGA